MRGEAKHKLRRTVVEGKQTTAGSSLATPWTTRARDAQSVGTTFLSGTLLNERKYTDAL